MSLGREFLVSIRIMVHTLLDHMLSCFPDPWVQEPAKQETGQRGATKEDLKTLAYELEYLFQHVQKLEKQVVRSHEILRTGEIKAKGESLVIYFIELMRMDEVVEPLLSSQHDTDLLPLVTVEPSVGKVQNLQDQKLPRA